MFTEGSHFFCERKINYWKINYSTRIIKAHAEGPNFLDPFGGGGNSTFLMVRIKAGKNKGLQPPIFFVGRKN